MNNITALVLRRMRTPLLVLVASYAVAILGLVLVPGVDDQGRLWHMDFFHAFYFVSYVATTIGFGEIPYAFSPAQRLWAVVCIYIGVIAWVYAIGTILTLVQDPAFQHALRESRFARGVRRMREPFYLVCGYGGTGSLLVGSLVERNLNAVVIDINPDRINNLRMADLTVYVPGLTADAGVPRHLLEAGLLNPMCAGVVALTDQDHTNLQIAIVAKLLRPGLEVICRAETRDTAVNMKSFGTRHTVNPFEAFAEHLALALHSPNMHVLFEWLTGVPRTSLAPVIYPPHGTWILCGYGRFGKAVRRFLDYEGVKSIVVEADPKKTACENCIHGRGTEAVTLREAGIERAAGIVAGTDDDANNLSILMTARDLNPNLFFVGRQNMRYNQAIFEAAHADLVMQRAQIIAREILALITAPLLSRFLRQARHQSQEWVEELVIHLGEVIGPVVPDIWTVSVSTENAPAVCGAVHEAVSVRLLHLMRDNCDRNKTLECVPLLLRREAKDELLPAEDTPLQAGDELLFCGRWGVASSMQWTLQNPNALNYIVTGEDRPVGWIWRLLAQRSA